MRYDVALGGAFAGRYGSAPGRARDATEGFGRLTLTGEARLNGHRYGSTPPPAQGEVIPDARELHRVITASVHELLETARLEAHAGPVDEAQLERLIFRAAAPIVQSVASFTEAQRGELLPHIVHVMLAAFLEAQAR